MNDTEELLQRILSKVTSMKSTQNLTDKEKKELERFDEWLRDDGPAALVIRELLEPIEGPDGVFFPATFAAEQGNAPNRFPGGYNIDIFDDGTNICLIDSVGSQANRMEPIFALNEYAGLVPQVSIKAGEKTIRLLEAGHRAGDAIVRCSEGLKDEIENAFKELLKGNAKRLTSIAPTSIVFGVWDSRGTGAKLPRLVSSTIRAFNVYRCTRHAQYNPAIRYEKEGLLDGINATEEKLAQKGYVDQPIGKQPDPKKSDPTHGGVQLMVNGSIRRDAILNLNTLRRLAVLGENGSILTDETQALRRYILGLALIALTATQETYLRQGCNLILAEEGKSRKFEIVYASGMRAPIFAVQEDASQFIKLNPKLPASIVINHGIVKEFAFLAARSFGIDPNRDRTRNELPDREVPFSKELARKDIKGDEEEAGGAATKAAKRK